MLSQFDVIYYLRDELPQLSETFYPTRIGCSIDTSLQTLVDYTTEAIDDHHLNIARKCFALAARFYAEGDSMVRNVITNTFIDSIQNHLSRDPKQEIIVQAMMPPAFLKIYHHRKFVKNK